MSELTPDEERARWLVRRTAVKLRVIVCWNTMLATALGVYASIWFGTAAAAAPIGVAGRLSGSVVACAVAYGVWVDTRRRAAHRLAILTQLRAYTVRDARLATTGRGSGTVRP